MSAAFDTNDFAGYVGVGIGRNGSDPTGVTVRLPPASALTEQSETAAMGSFGGLCRIVAAFSTIKPSRSLLIRNSHSGNNCFRPTRFAV